MSNDNTLGNSPTSLKPRHRHHESELAPTPRQPVRQEIFELLKSHDRAFTTRRISELIDTDVSYNHISGIVRRMASDGLVESAKSSIDGRKWFIAGQRNLTQRLLPRRSCACILHNGYSVIVITTKRKYRSGT